MGARDFLGREAADFAQRQGDLPIGRQCRVTTGEDEPQPVVLDALVLARMGSGDGFQLFGDVLERSFEAGAPADPVDRLEAARGHEPCARILRDALGRPLLHRGDEGVVQRFLGDIEITEQANQGGEHPPGFGAIDRLDRVHAIRLVQECRRLSGWRIIDGNRSLRRGSFVTGY